MKQTLMVKKVRTGYVVDFAQTVEADEMRSLFGTTRIPTPFTTEASPTMVIAEIQARNPQYRVLLVD